MKNFFKDIVLTFHSSSFYKKIKDESAGNGIEFLLKISVLLGLLVGLVLVIVFFAFAPMLKSGALGFIEKTYPAGLEVTIKDGKLTTNTNQPVLIKIPASTNAKDKESKENMVAILPNEKAEVSVLKKYDTYIALTSEGLVADKGNGAEIRILSYGKTSQTFTKDSSIELVSSLLGKIKIFFAIAIVPIGIFIVFFTIVAHLIWLFLVALIIWIIFKLKKLKISYAQSYKIGMYAIVPLVMLEMLAIPFKFSGKLFTTIVILALVFIVTRDWQEEKPEILPVQGEIKN